MLSFKQFKSTKSDAMMPLINEFVEYCTNFLEIDDTPQITIVKDGSIGTAFGCYCEGEIKLNIINRHPMDVLRTLAHEIVHYKQDLDGELHETSGETGSDHENEANSMAGVLMRNFGRDNPDLFSFGAILESLNESEVFGKVFHFTMQDGRRIHFIPQSILKNGRYKGLQFDEGSAGRSAKKPVNTSWDRQFFNQSVETPQHEIPNHVMPYISLQELKVDDNNGGGWGGGPGKWHPPTVLRHEQSGKQIKVGDTVTTFRGEKGKVKYIAPPRHEASQGHVETTLGYHYASVYGCKFFHV
jgi:hypothetical protein